MANDKNPLGQLKDLVELKDQLEDIQRRVEDEIQAGVPPGGSLLASPFLKGFLAGYVVARLRSSALVYLSCWNKLHNADHECSSYPCLQMCVRAFNNSFILLRLAKHHLKEIYLMPRRSGQSCFLIHSLNYINE
uniref:Uncharacterized protein n=1 Tax=Amphiprion percula TaxID=161767 RepID=A0A3P8RSF4_AMPPE